MTNKELSGLLVDLGEHTVGYAIAEQVAASCIRKQTEHEPVSEPVSSVPLLFLLQTFALAPACLSMMDCDLKV